jgi:hypothetical protein
MPAVDTHKEQQVWRSRVSAQQVSKQHGSKGSRGMNGGMITVINSWPAEDRFAPHVW